MKAILWFLVVAIAGMSLGGCTAMPIPVSESQTPSLVASAKERVAAPDVPSADVTDVAAGNAAFAFDLYKALRGRAGNLFFSPHSISAALAMTYAGARGDTRAQMAEALRFALEGDRLHAAFNALDQELASRGEGAQGKDDQGFRLNIVNAIWGQTGFEFLDEFLNILAENYGAGLRVLDFAKNPEQSRVAINDWVSDETEGRIEDLIPAGVIDPLTRLVLTNAIYFNAAWAFAFAPEGTKDGPFHLLNGSEVMVPMMHQEESFAYVDAESYQAVELPYDGTELSMVILVPREGEFDQFEGSLDVDTFDAVVSDFRRGKVALTMPRFEYEGEFMLEDALVGLGMVDAFSSGADFSGMTGNRDLFISDVIHKAFVSVDESGTEAAAATAVVMKLTAEMPEEPVQLAVDRPFVFLIRDIPTGAVLFVGRVLDPSV